ncbi:DUF2783 domain-containing protein [Muricoccus radiodurans]|uniref:DUF2783 domain-containing protein n=1 Tax=Muricoccus radiodurans TaxID=2231721 RepID=UPI003CF10215
MTALTLDANLADPDAFYEALIEAHRGLTDEQSQMVNARLILILANQIGDLGLLRQAVDKARDGIAEEGKD